MPRNSFKYVNYTDLKKFSSDFKAVYNAPNETAALSELENIKEKWGKKYPYAISNWENNWEDVSSFFQFSDDIRRIMYTTNIIEGLNRQYRKVTKTKSVFPSDTALEKMLYLASENVVKKWTQRYRNWDQVLNQLIVLYGERLTAYPGWGRKPDQAYPAGAVRPGHRRRGRVWLYLRCRGPADPGYGAVGGSGGGLRIRPDGQLHRKEGCPGGLPLLCLRA